MSSIKIILYRQKKLKNGEHPVALYIYEEKVYRLFLGYSCLPKYWDAKVGKFRKTYPNAEVKNLLLRKLELKANEIIDDFVREGSFFSFQIFKEKFKGIKKEISFDSFFHEMINEKRSLGKVGTAMAYRDAFNALKRYKKPEVLFREIDYNLLKGLEVFLLKNGCSAGGAGAYMRSIRAVYYEGARRGLVDREINPFSTAGNKNGYSLSKLKSVKNPKALSKVDLQSLKAFDLQKHPEFADTWRLFMFSFYLFGMNFIDMSQLTKDNCKNGRLIYIRQKTNKPFNLKVRQEAQEILDYFSSSTSKLLFPILDEKIHITPQQKKDRTHRVRRKINKELARITKIQGIETSITFYSARHTSATAMKRCGVSTDVISEALGHSDLTITQHYLSKFDNEVLDTAIMEL
jgi:integrase/recombinase XerD